MAPSLPLIRIDAVLMQRVMSNLCSNAIKHTPPNTRVSLGAALETDYVRLWVHDTGPGIPPEYRDTLFSPFSIKTATEGKQTSTGLGLSFCKLAVEAHEGELTLYSSPADGTLFSVLIPRDAEHVVSEPSARNATYGVSESGTQTDGSFAHI